MTTTLQDVNAYRHTDAGETPVYKPGIVIEETIARSQITGLGLDASDDYGDFTSTKSIETGNIRQSGLRTEVYSSDVSVSDRQIAEHDVVVREVKGGMAHISVVADGKSREFSVSVNGMIEYGAGSVTEGDRFFLHIFKSATGYATRFVKKPESSVIQFQETISEPDQDYIQFKLKQIKGIDGPDA